MIFIVRFISIFDYQKLIFELKIYFNVNFGFFHFGLLLFIIFLQFFSTYYTFRHFLLILIDLNYFHIVILHLFHLIFTKFSY